MATHKVVIMSATQNQGERSSIIDPVEVLAKANKINWDAPRARTLPGEVGRGELSTDSSQSSGGQPVLLWDGKVIGVGDLDRDLRILPELPKGWNPTGDSTTEYKPNIWLSWEEARNEYLAGRRGRNLA